ncbi:hypothetical protein Fot_49993 [Forsythia ovata]|uniref:Uncharacterized protein n=1 Tax=Forsythia ovata TaxID=205694 RepID=A0ABD1PWX9_9LAMI
MSECDNEEEVGRGELGCEIGPEGDIAGNDNNNVGLENERENAGVDGQLETDGNATGVPEGTYVPEFSENADCNIEVDWEAFLDKHQEDIWNSWENGLGMNNEEETQHADESEEHEVQTEEFWKELGETSTTTNNLQHVIDLASYDKEVIDYPLEMNQEVVKVMFESRQDIWNNKELRELINEFYKNSLNNLKSYLALDKSLKDTTDTLLLQHFVEGNDWNLNNFKVTSNSFCQEFACLYQQHISTVDKLQMYKTKLDEKQNCIHAWIKLSRIIFTILAVVVLIGSGVTIATVTSRLATALATTATSIPLGSIGMWIYYMLNKYKNVVKAHKDIINWLNGWTQLAIKDLAKILVHMASADFVVNQGTLKLSIEETTSNLNDLRVKVVDCSNNTRKARTAILQKIIKNPNHLDIADAAFPSF